VQIEDLKRIRNGGLSHPLREHPWSPVSLGVANSGTARSSRKKASAPKELRPNGWPLSGGLFGGKFGGIDLRSRLVLLLRAVEFEDAADVNLGDPMLDGCGYFLRTVLFLVFAVTQLTLDLYVTLSAGSIYPQQGPLLFYQPSH
jgi:hypothetical protein